MASSRRMHTAACALFVLAGCHPRATTSPRQDCIEPECVECLDVSVPGVTLVQPKDGDRVRTNAFHVMVANVDGHGPAEVIAIETTARHHKLEDMPGFTRDEERSTARVFAANERGILELQSVSEVVQGDESVDRIADFDGDGHADLVLGGDSRSLWLHRGTGKEGFGAGAEVSLGHFPYDAAVIDFDGDGILDLATLGSEEDPGQMALLEASAHALVLTSWPTEGTTAQVRTVRDLPGYPRRLVAARTDDGTDVLVVQEDVRVVPRRRAGYSYRSMAKDLVADDLDGDGIDEVMLLSDEKSVLVRDARGALRSTIATGRDAAGVLVGDANGDDLPDLLVHGWGRSGRVWRFHLGQGDARLSRAKCLPGHPDHMPVGWTDVTGDGRAEVVAVDSGKRCVSLTPVDDLVPCR